MPSVMILWAFTVFPAEIAIINVSSFKFYSTLLLCNKEISSLRISLIDDLNFK